MVELDSLNMVVDRLVHACITEQTTVHGLINEQT